MEAKSALSGHQRASTCPDVRGVTMSSLIAQLFVFSHAEESRTFPDIAI
jgi:hypothetical protein